MSPFLPLLLFLLIILNIPASLGDSETFEGCSSSFRCGPRFTAGYPFWGGGRPDYCGHPDLELICEDHQTPSIFINEVQYSVLSINNESQTLRMARADYQREYCHPTPVDTALVSPLLQLSSNFEMIAFYYGCPPSPPSVKGKFTCSYEHGFVKPGVDGPEHCRFSVTVPINKSYIPKELGDLSVVQRGLREGFEVRWNVGGIGCEECLKSTGSCGYSREGNQAVCFCRNQQSEMLTACPDFEEASASSGKRRLATATAAGIAVGAAGALAILGALVYLIIRRRRTKMAAKLVSKDLETPHSSKNTNITGTTTTASNSTSTDFSSVPSSYRSSKSDVGKASAYFGAQVFNCLELEEATNNFDSSKELGDGGFGTVYHGVLKDGREVAVKRLYEHNFKRMEQFMTEVEILTRLRHPNLVMLYGCTSRRSRELLLVYEYVRNGALADHLTGRQSNTNMVAWPTRLSIAIETANALAYLHASDVIHRDVKSNNILLDQKFHVKVADFGLSRLFPNDVTHVSTAPQGTPGYVDPEYYQCYQLTDKSDVYSFGVVLIELISSLPAVDTERIRHDINLSNMAINRIQNHKLHELVDQNLGFETDYKVRTMITSVAELAFRCLQQDREMRPSMQEVLEVLRGIRNNGKDKAEEVDICNTNDEVVLLKNTPPPVSPDSSSF